MFSPKPRNGNDNISSEEHFLIKKPFEVLKSLFKFYLVTQSLYFTFRHSSSGMGAAKLDRDSEPYKAVAKFTVPDWGGIVDSSIGLSYRVPARQAT
jgi:hypothetical protein